MVHTYKFRCFIKERLKVRINLSTFQETKKSLLRLITYLCLQLQVINKSNTTIIFYLLYSVALLSDYMFRPLLN